MAKYRALRELLLAEGTLAPGEVHASPVAPVAWLERAHDPAYVARALACALAGTTAKATR
jgi:hypothetical protein